MTSACNGSGSCVTSSTMCQYRCKIGGGTTCAPCRQQNDNNLLVNPGLDGSGQSWTLRGNSIYSTTDSDGCSASGSLLTSDINSELIQCRPITGGERYVYGFRFKAQTAGLSHQGYCGLAFFASLDCSGTAIYDENAVSAQVTPAGTAWVNASGHATAPANARSAEIGCIAHVGFGYYDQFYLSTTTEGF